MILLLDIGNKYKTDKSSQKQRCGICVCQKCGEIFERRIAKNKSQALCKPCTIVLRTTHGESKTRLYQIWANMRIRCNAKSGLFFECYAQRGIKVCKEWDSDFLAFKKFALENGYLYHLKGDIIDNNKGYNPTNCRFVTMSVQARNTRRIRSNNTIGYRGVIFHKNNNKYSANICVNWKRINLGCFKDPITAAKAYDKYVIDNNLEHTINFPETACLNN